MRRERYGSANVVGVRVQKTIGVTLAVGLTFGVGLSSGHAIAIFACVVFAIFAFVIAFSPPLRLYSWELLSPIGFVVFMFTIQLVVFPALVLGLGPRVGQLPYLPDSTALMLAISAEAMMFVVFAVTVMALKRDSAPSGVADATLPPSIVMIVLFAAVGVGGVMLAFGGISSLAQYYTSSQRPLSVAGKSASVISVIGVFLRPFLGVSVILAWARVAHFKKDQFKESQLLVIIALVLVAYSVYGYNRGAMVSAVLALLAAHVRTVKKLRKVTMMYSVVFGILLIAGAGEARGNSTGGYAWIMDSHSWLTILARVDWNGQFQAYFGGPQYLAFVMERSVGQGAPMMGATLLGSVLHPVPLVSDGLRDSSGVAIYNRWIYGQDVTWGDQILSIAGEMYLNFRMLGIAIWAVVLGIAASRLQFWFDRTEDPYESFVIAYCGYWLAFSMVGSIAIASQVAIYFLGPVLIGLVLTRLARRRPGSGR